MQHCWQRAGRRAAQNRGSGAWLWPQLCPVLAKCCPRMLFLSPGVPTCLPPDPESNGERHLTLCPSGPAMLVSSGFLSGLWLLLFLLTFIHLATLGLSHDTWDLVPRDQTWTPCIGSTES